jgi:hypothetical protein
MSNTKTEVENEVEEVVLTAEQKQAKLAEAKEKAERDANINAWVAKRDALIDALDLRNQSINMIFHIQKELEQSKISKYMEYARSNKDLIETSYNFLDSIGKAQSAYKAKTNENIAKSQASFQAKSVSRVGS